MNRTNKTQEQSKLKAIAQLLRFVAHYLDDMAEREGVAALEKTELAAIANVLQKLAGAV